MMRSLGLTLLTLSLAVPPVSLALGLGDIHVESALHEPLVAQIELLGAVDDELGRVSAEIPDGDTFERYALERPVFLAGTKLVVGKDSQGRPVLNLRSTDRFVEPVVTLLVELHTPNGELIREYTVFLDPPGLSPKAMTAASAGSPQLGSADASANATSGESVTAAHPTPASPFAPTTSDTSIAPAEVAAQVAPAVPTAGAGRQRPSPRPVTNTDTNTTRLGTTYTVAPHDTLDHIVTAAGAHSRIERHRMMIAIFRANPAAFRNNFNRLHAGVTLTFPSAQQLSALSADEVNREYDEQMLAWREPGHPVASESASGTTAAAARLAQVAAPQPLPAGMAADAAITNADPNARQGDRKQAIEALQTERAMLTQRVTSLQQSLVALRQQLQQPPASKTAAPAHATAGITPTLAASPASTTATLRTLPASTTDAPVASIAAFAETAVRPAAAAATTVSTAEEATDGDDSEPVPAHNHKLQLILMVAGVGLIFLTGIWLFLRSRNSGTHSAGRGHSLWRAHRNLEIQPDEAAERPLEFTMPTTPLQQPTEEASAAAEKPAGEPALAALVAAVPKAAKGESSWFEDSFSTPIAELLASQPKVGTAVEATAEVPAENTVKLATSIATKEIDTTVMLAPDLDFVGDTVEQKFSFFNPEATQNTEHVVMGDGLNEPKPFAERRRNPADVLRQAIEREPDRSDLRMKLLELYYQAAEENRGAFLEAARQLAKNRKLASAEEWARISDMGRSIAPHHELFREELDDPRVAKLLSA